MILLLLLAIGTGVQAQKMTISGMVPGNGEVTLKAFVDSTMNYQPLARAKVTNGRYELKIVHEQPNLYLVATEGGQSARLSVSAPRDVQVDFKGEKVEIKGSEESLSMSQFEALNGQLQDKHFGQLKQEADAAMAAGDKEALAKIQERSQVAISEFLVEFRAALVDMGETPAGYYALQFSDFNKELEFISQRLVAFEKAIPESPVTKALAQQVYRAKVVAIGQKPPAIDATDRNGEVVDLSAYKGKVVLIDFWAAWCRACRIENPQFASLYASYKDKGLEVLSISQDKDPATWEKAIAKDGVAAFRHVQDANGAISDLYSVSSLPQNVLLSKEGIIIAKNINAEQLKAILEEGI